MANKRSGKWYRKNEAEVMESLGLRPTKNSGSGWVEKEDGQSDKLICQLKSTDAQSISVKLQDVHTLEYNADVCHKIPVFAIQFISTGEVLLMVKPENLCDVAKYIETGECDIRESILDGDRTETQVKKRSQVKSSSSARERFHEERKSKYKKERRAW